MLFGTTEHLEAYGGLQREIVRGLELLRDTDFSALPDGRYEVEGDDLFFSLQSYETKPSNELPEAHRLYVDIQYLISGREHIDFAPLAHMTEIAEARPEGDIWLHRGPVSGRLTLGDGSFAIFWPEDAHAPGIAVNAPEPCRKCVVKVKVKT